MHLSHQHFLPVLDCSWSNSCLASSRVLCNSASTFEMHFMTFWTIGGQNSNFSSNSAQANPVYTISKSATSTSQPPAQKKKHQTVSPGSRPLPRLVSPRATKRQHQYNAILIQIPLKVFRQTFVQSNFIHPSCKGLGLDRHYEWTIFDTRDLKPT